MEGIGSEVSHKIRAAIKAKLIELGAYVDDELPDYIMVMVANKRTRSQMNEDLQLFLTTNTKTFTSWLHTVLQKLQEVTVATFESKKDSETKKLKRKKEVEEISTRSQKSFEEVSSKSKKHSKKHKESKKSKKNKHKSKEKSKLKSNKKEKEGSEGKNESKASQDKSKPKLSQLNDAVGEAILENFKKNKKICRDKSSSGSSSSTNDSSVEEEQDKVNKKVTESSLQDKNLRGEDVLNIRINDEVKGNKMENRVKEELIEDEFNIEPLKPREKALEEESKERNKIEEDKIKLLESDAQVSTTISAPTKELLKQHDKLQNQKLEAENKNQDHKVNGSDSEDSISPEEMRKQLLLSRAKKKLEESKLAERMKSNSPEILSVYVVSKKAKESGLALRSSMSPRSESSNHVSGKPQSHVSDRRSRSPNVSSKKETVDIRSKIKGKDDNDDDDDKKLIINSGMDKEPKNKEGKKSVIKISESLEKEKNLLMKTDKERKSKEKETFSRRRPLSSRVVTITDPEGPEIPSIVKVKPREFVSKDKQANKALILKAVADAEKSIAKIQPRTEHEPDPKKGLFTKKLREKRFEKLAVTLSNVRKNPDLRDRMGRRVSVDSEKSERSRLKHDSSDVSEGARVTSKKLLKSDDQFISSKTSLMEKNDKYIRCWLEGVEKAVKEDEMVNPNDMEDFILSSLTDDENDLSETTKKDEDKKRKRSPNPQSGDPSSKTRKQTDKEDQKPVPETAETTSDGEEPQIVVTLDGLNSKIIKDLISRNKEHKSVLPPKKKPPERDDQPSGFEKISDRFARLNRVEQSEKKSWKEKNETGPTESKNRQLIAQLSEKFGKVDREFENKKRKHPGGDRRYESRRNDKEEGRNGKYRRSVREGGFGFYRR